VGPLFTVTTYQAMDINGYTFYTMAQDAKSVYQNSGVRVRAVNNDMQAATYYGQIEEIWELDYVGFKVALFRCRWLNGKRGVSKDKYGFVSVDLRVFGYKDEPFVFAKDVEQVFYVPDLARKNWCVVMPGKKKGLLGLPMLLRRRNTTSLMKFHPLTLHTCPDSWQLTKHRTCEPTIMKKSIYRNQRKSKIDVC
jgi:hypothetical protein